MRILQYKVHHWTNNILIALAFALPLIPRFQLPFLLALFLLFILNRQKQNWRNLTGKWPAILLIIFYLYHLVGLCWTENFGTAALDLQIKLPLLILPLVVFYGNQIEKSTRAKIYSYFNYGIETAIYFCFARAVFFYLQGNSSYFFYKDFSFFIHPGYFAMFICLGTVILLQRVITNSQMVNFVVALHWFRIFLFTAALILLSSKAGIFVQLTIMVLAVIVAWRKRRSTNSRNYRYPALLAILVLYFGLFSPVTSLRMNEMQQTISQPGTGEIHSTAMRLQAWECAAALISEHPVKGAGTGDAKTVLMEKYSEKGYTEVYNRSLNAHNQFLQTAVTLGIPAFLLLGLLLLLAFYNAVTTKNWLLLSFLLITCFNFMVESILEVTAGTLYFGLFYSLLTNDEDLF